MKHTGSFSFCIYILYTNSHTNYDNSGVNVRLVYFVRVTITRNYNSCIKDQEFAVQNFSPVNDSIF